MSSLGVLGCGDNGRDGARNALEVDCADFCAKCAECLGAKEKECVEECLTRYEDPKLGCLRLCDRQGDCVLYALCAGYCIVKK